MPKLIGLFRRAPGLSHDDFREYYETRHAPLATSLFGDLFRSYTRNYVDPAQNEANGPLDSSRVRNADVDVVTEIVFDDQESMDQMFARSAGDAGVREAIATDEAAFMDRPATRLLIIADHRDS